MVAAAGNDGATAVHATATLDGASPADFVLRFPAKSARAKGRPRCRRSPAPWSAQVLVVDRSASPLAATATVGPGGPGQTTMLQSEGVEFGSVALDAEADPNLFNEKGHITASVDLPSWTDAPAGDGWMMVRLRGRGHVDLWVDTPPEQPAEASFDRDAVTGGATEVAGDFAASVGDLATAVSIVAVSRTEFPSARGTATISAVLGAVAPFSAFGPTLDPGRTGPKPDMAAPGNVVVAARGIDTPMGPDTVSLLYRSAAGTSAAAPHVGGGCRAHPRGAPLRHQGGAETGAPADGDGGRPGQSRSR